MVKIYYTRSDYCTFCLSQLIHVVIYRIMQIVRGGKDSRFHDLVIHGKTFAIIQQFETPYNKKEKNY